MFLLRQFLRKYKRNILQIKHFWKKNILFEEKKRKILVSIGFAREI